MSQCIGGYYKGDKVETHSLSKEDFNGLLCAVVDFKESDGRLVVQLPQSAIGTGALETLNVKPANLKLIQAGEEHAEADRLAKQKEGGQQPEAHAAAATSTSGGYTLTHSTEASTPVTADTLKRGEGEGQQQEGATLKKKEEERHQDETQRNEKEKPQADCATSAADAPSLVIGDTVELHSLSTASLNGERGKVISLPDDQGDRLRVDLGKLGIKAFKPDNLRFVAPTAEELMWKASLAALQKVAYVQVPSGWDPKPVLMAVVSALQPCADSKARKARIGDVVLTMPVERRISPELGDQPMSLEEVMAGLEKKYPSWKLERRQDHWDRLDKKERSQLEAMEARTRDDDGTWTLERCECARVVEVHEDGDFWLENPRGVVSELIVRSRFGFVGASELSKSAGGYVLANQPNLLPIQCRVRTLALSTAENNGLEGVVENYYKDRGRYEVKFGDKSMALKSSNLLQLMDVKLTTGSDSIDASVTGFDTVTSDFLLSVGGESRPAKFNAFVLNHTAYVDGSFRNGARVIVHGLAAEAAKQWNECMGEVVGYDRDVQRYLIQVSPTAQLKIKPDNVRYCPL